MWYVFFITINQEWSIGINSASYLGQVKLLVSHPEIFKSLR